MTSNGNSPNADAGDRRVGDENVERLLCEAYEPEFPDAAFAARVRRRVRAAAKARRSSARLTAFRPIRALPWVAIAAAVIVAVSVIVSIALRPAPPKRGGYVTTPGRFVEPGWLAARPGSARHEIGADGLTARPRPAAPPVEPAAVGASIRTTATQRRRVALPDGSILYANRSTRLAVEGRRRVRLAAGEVYVEVAPDAAGGASFTVATPTRTVSALGTKFTVRVGSAGTNVAVVQGTVQVSGYSGLLHAGRQLDCGRGGTGGRPASIPRASHVLAWTKDLAAAADSPLVPGSEHAGGALVAVDPQGQEARLSLRKYHVDVHVEDGFARTTIDQTYFNHMNQRLEGTFYFPLPPDASISRLAMYVAGRLMEGGMAEREHARYVFEDIMHTRRDPALLEWVDGNTFKMRVFPLEARQEKRIIISYTQRLEGLYGRTEYRFPGGHNMPVVGEWSFHARAVAAADLDWACPTHDLKAAKKDGDLLLDLGLKAVKPDADVVVHLFDADPLAQATDLERFSSAEHEGHRYLMLRYRPNLKDPRQRVDAGVGAAPAPRPARDWVFLFESSGDRDPLLARAQVDVIRTMLAHVEHDDRFTVLAAGTHVRTWAESPQPASVENVKAAVAFLEKSHLVGALDLEGAFAAAGEVLREADNPYLVHVGAGIPVLGERQTDRLVKLIPAGARYVGVGVGKRWSRSLMKEAAAHTGGYFAHVNPDEKVNWRAFEVISTLNTPRLLNVSVSCEPARAQWLCFNDSIAQGEELCAVARLGKDVMLPAVVTVTGTLDGKPYSRQIAVQDVAAGADYLPRFWAKLEIDRLVAADAKTNRPQIVALSKAMYVMSPFTSLLVLENEAMYKQYKVDRGRKDHWALYPAPAKIAVVYEPDPRWATRRPPRDAADETKKLSPEEVLNTILIRIPPQVLRWPNDPGHYPGGQSLTALQVLSGAYAVPYVYDYSGSGSGGGGGVDYKYKLGVLDVDGTVAADRRYVSLLGLPAGGAEPGGPGSVWHSTGRKFNELLRPVDVLETADKRSLPFTNGRLAAFSGKDLSRIVAEGDEWRRKGRLGETVDDLTEWLGRLSKSAGEEIGGWTGFRGGRGTSPFGDRRLGQPRPVASAMPVPATRPAGFLFAAPRRPPPPALQPVASKELRGLRRGDAYDYVADSLHYRLRTGRWQRNVLYQRPRFTGHYQVFSDLLAYAPGMNTTSADVWAVVEAEARPDKPAAPGRIDPKARALIDKARRGGFSAVTFPDGNGKPAVTVVFDAAGRYAWRRTTWAGLDERVVCDGKTLWQLYDEIGLGVRRAVSRFHRAEFCSMVPWVLPPAEDLAHGADLLHLGERTVAVSPAGAENAKDEKGKPVPYFRVHLVFAAGGRLAERQVVEMPAGKTLWRQTYDADGTVRWLDEKGKELASVKLPLRVTPAPEPNLKPDLSRLVVLPMPFRTRDHYVRTHKIKHPGRYELWDADDAVELIATDLAHRNSELYNIIGERFAGKGDRRVGFYVLLMAARDQWDIRNLHHFRTGKVYLDPVKDHPRSPAAQYVAQWVRWRQTGQTEAPAPIGDAGEGFVQNLAGFRYLHFRWNSGQATRGDQAHRRRERERALDYVRACKSSLFGWAVLSRVQDYGGDRQFHQAVAKASQAFEDVTGLSYVARYEGARALYRSGRYPQAAEAFEKLYADTLERGALPLIDSDFRNAFQARSETTPRWTKLMRDTSAALTKKNARAAAVVLAWQCWQVGDRPLAEELLAAAMTGADDTQRVGVALTAFEYLYTTGQRDRANAVLTPLLEDEQLADNPWLWRLGALAASSRGRTAESLKRLERAMDIEYRELPDVINLKAVRQDYGQLLSRYQQLAQAIATLEQAPPGELVVRVIRAADRWRSLDADDANACNSAARIFQALGARELAWEYLTTPLAMRPNEAAPWVSMANQLKQEGEFDLADRAYASAFEAEGTNARILWDRAQLLQQTGQHDRARELYRKIAEGKWPRQFNGLQQQARRYLDMQ